MSTLTIMLMFVGGGLGAAARLALDGIIRSRVRTTYPVATTIINLTGSMLLGLVTGLVGQHMLPAAWQLIAGTGFLGGYTTFSTASFETIRLVEERRLVSASLNSLGMVIMGTALAAAGLAAATLVGP